MEGRWVGRALGEGTMGRAPGVWDVMEAASEKLPGRWRPFPLGCAWLRGLLRQGRRMVRTRRFPHTEKELRV